ncbi:iron dicitrate transport regulator FecR [Pseudomonas sp. EpS/L25]|nr:iron dicitrate transport regulator FecR [Pseudomonas sp. EpS/L25]
MTSLMLAEAAASGAAVARQLETIDQALADLAADLRANPPQLALTVARGSSDHAASYFAYLAMAHLGLPVLSLPPSLVTLRQAPLRVEGQLALGFSQSGRSPDLIETLTALDRYGARTAALVNEIDSPLALACRHALGVQAGPEHSIAATKSFIATLAAAARLIAHWQQDETLLAAGTALPEALDHAAELSWAPALPVLRDAERCMVVGRGPGFAIAQEAALKLKETSALQGEAFSGAELQHGPLALVERGYPLLIFALRGPEQAGLLQLARDLRGRGARVLLAAPEDIAERDLPLVTAAHPDLDGLLAIQSFYRMAALLAEARGQDPDQPRHLRKVTLTR